MSKLPKLLDRDELAALVKRSPKTIANWVQEGKGPRAIRIEGGNVVYDERDVAAWLRAQGVRA